MTKCPSCEAMIPDHVSRCPICYRDNRDPRILPGDHDIPDPRTATQVAEARPMPEWLPHQQRVVDELFELSTKIDNLWAFIDKSQTYKELPIEESRLLGKQLYLMQSYSNILLQRIARFKPSQP